MNENFFLCEELNSNMTRYWSELLSDTPADCVYKITRYGDLLAYNKRKIIAAIPIGAPPSFGALLIAMAMVETTTLSSADRDASKDTRGDAANVSLFNLSLDLVKCLGYTEDPWIFNDAKNLSELTQLLWGGMQKWGVHALLNFVRGGRTGFQDHHSYDCAGYRRTIATMLKLIDADPSLLTDNRRIEIELRHV